jgi:hypothetical protein
MTCIGRDERLDRGEATLQACVVKCSLPASRLGVVDICLCCGEHLDDLRVSVVRCVPIGEISTRHRELTWNSCASPAIISGVSLLVVRVDIEQPA